MLLPAFVKAVLIPQNVTSQIQVSGMEDSLEWSTMRIDIDFEECNPLLGRQLDCRALDVNEVVYEDDRDWGLIFPQPPESEFESEPDLDSEFGSESGQ